MKVAATHSTFAGARLLEPIECRQHIEFIERRIAAKRLVDAPQCPKRLVGDVAGLIYPVRPSSIKTPHPMSFDDTANTGTAKTTSGFRCLYCVLIFPTNAKRKKHVREKHAGVSEPRLTKTPLVWDSPVRLPWGWKKIKAEGCYTEAIPRTWVPLTTGFMEPVVPSAFSITNHAPTPQPPPAPLPSLPIRLDMNRPQSCRNGSPYRRKVSAFCRSVSILTNHISIPNFGGNCSTVQLHPGLI
jgi:hypothetical protein